MMHTMYVALYDCVSQMFLWHSQLHSQELQEEVS